MEDCFSARVTGRISAGTSFVLVFIRTTWIQARAVDNELVATEQCKPRHIDEGLSYLIASY